MDEIIKILVVQSKEEDRRLVYQALRRRVNVEFCEAHDCHSALVTLKAYSSFECVFLDYRLPDGDGLWLVQKIRASGIKVPLVVLTQKGDEEIAVKLMKAGASDYLAKDKVSPDSLCRSLHHALRIYRAEQEALQANSRLRESEERYRLVLEGSNHGIWDLDCQSQQLHANERLWEIVGLTTKATAFDYELFDELLHPQDRPKFRKLVAAEEPKQVELVWEFRIRHCQGDYRCCLFKGKVLRDNLGQALRISGIVDDITQRKRLEERSNFLAQASTLLSATVDSQVTLENLAWLAVSRMADFCAIDIVDENLCYRRIAVAHVNQAKESLVWRLKLRHPEIFNGVPKLQTLKALQISEEEADIQLNRLVKNRKQLKLLAQLKVCAYILVPLSIGERTLGAMLFAWSDSGRYYTEEDVTLAEDLARRAAWALENARLYREVQEANENLSEAILILGEQEQQLRTLQKLTNLLNQRLTNLPDLLKVMAESVCKAIAGAQICFITLFNPQCDSMVLTVVAGKNKDNLHLEQNFSNHDGWLYQIFLTGESQLIQATPSQLEEDQDVPAAIYAVAIESVQSGRLGVLAVGNWDNSAAFSEDNRSLLTAVGEQAAIAIDNARLITTLETREESLELQNQVLEAQNAELEQQRQQIHRKNLQLIEAAKLKSQFLATMSHELRTPMNAIIGFSQLLLRRRYLEDRPTEMVKRILNNGQHLLGLIDGILDLSRIEAGRLELQTESFDLVELTSSTINELRSLAEQRRLSLEFHSPLSNVIVINDSTRLRQVLVNLISNAIKFTETGGIKVRVDEPSPKQIELQVQDTGIGITKEQQKHIFDEFWQVDQSTTRKYGGTGLGLAITESLVVLMKGKITVESELGQGSTFRLEFPREVQ